MEQKKIIELCNRALLKRKKHNYESALMIYKEVLQYSSSYRPAILGIACTYSQIKKTKEAIQYFGKAYKIKKDAALCFNIGSEYFKLCKYKEARKFLKESLKLDKRLLKSHLLLAYLYQKIKQHDKAGVYFQNTLKLDPINRMAILGYASSLSQQGFYENALYAIEYYLSKVEIDVFAQEMRAALLLELGKVQKAYKDYNKLVKTSPKFRSFSDHLVALGKETGMEYKEHFGDIDGKISKKVKQVKARLETKNQKLEKENRRDNSKDMVDLSLLHLFKGNTEQALKYLFQARLNALKK